VLNGTPVMIFRTFHIAIQMKKWCQAFVLAQCRILIRRANDNFAYHCICRKILSRYTDQAQAPGERKYSQSSGYT